MKMIREDDVVTTEDLREQNELADSLIAKLNRIKALWAEMPHEAETGDLEKAMGNIEVSAAKIVDICNSDDFPSADDFDDLNKQCASIVNDLTEIVRLQEQVAETPSEGSTAQECLNEYKGGLCKDGFVARKKEEVNSNAETNERRRLLKNRMYLLRNGQYFWYIAPWDDHGNRSGMVASNIQPVDGGVRLEHKIIHHSELEKAEVISEVQEPWVLDEE